MTSTRNTRRDVVEAAGRLFAAKGYHGTSMRDLGRELGMLGGSLYSHVDSKQELLVDVVQQGASLFEASASLALAASDDPAERLRALIVGHIGVIVGNIDVARTFLNEARVLDDHYRARVLEARDRYESVFREVLAEGARRGVFRKDIDPALSSIMILSILNALERWYDPAGRVDPESLAERLYEFVYRALR